MNYENNKDNGFTHTRRKTHSRVQSNSKGKKTDLNDQQEPGYFIIRVSALIIFAAGYAQYFHTL